MINKLTLIAVVMFIGCEPIPTSHAGDPHYLPESTSETIFVTRESEQIGTALSLSFAAQSFDFNSNKKQWAVGLGRFDNDNAFSVGIGGTVNSGKDRLLLNSGFGIEQGKYGLNLGIGGRF